MDRDLLFAVDLFSNHVDSISSAPHPGRPFGRRERQ